MVKRAEIICDTYTSTYAQGVIGMKMCGTVVCVRLLVDVFGNGGLHVEECVATEAALSKRVQETY